LFAEIGELAALRNLEVDAWALQLLDTRGSWSVRRELCFSLCFQFLRALGDGRQRGSRAKLLLSLFEQSGVTSCCLGGADRMLRLNVGFLGSRIRENHRRRRLFDYGRWAFSVCGSFVSQCPFDPCWEIAETKEGERFIEACTGIVMVS